MSLLTLLGLIAILVTVALTLIVYFASDAGDGQSRRSSLIEAWINVAIGFSINFAANFLIFPLVGLHVSASQNWWLGCIYTAISVARSYVIRRWFNGRLIAVARRIAGAA